MGKSFTIQKGEQSKKPGTFAGVFTPPILTILGIILFLRTGFVVGNAGLKRPLAIIAIATAISVLTRDVHYGCSQFPFGNDNLLMKMKKSTF
jgi:membrane protein CcdC involved in cytochrome C biogenesis